MKRLLLRCIPFVVLAFIGINGYQEILAMAGTAINCTKISVTESDLGNYIGMVALEHQSGQGVPRDFRAFLRENFAKPTGTYKELWQDAWLSDYIYERSPGGCLIRSPGPDRQAGTEDDIVRRYGEI